MIRPLLVIDDGDGAALVLARARERLRSEGWDVVDGLGTRPARTRVVLAGRITSAEDAATAVMAAIDGFGLLLHAAVRGDTLHRLVDDLRRLGPVDHLGGEGGVDDRRSGPDPEGLRILALLAEGHTLGEAADLLGLSRRTADRRLARARGALGVTRTTEAIAVAARRGMLRPARPR